MIVTKKIRSVNTETIQSFFPQENHHQSERKPSKRFNKKSLTGKNWTILNSTILYYTIFEVYDQNLAEIFLPKCSFEKYFFLVPTRKDTQKWNLNVRKFWHTLDGINPKNIRFGFFPKLNTCSRTQDAKRWLIYLLSRYFGHSEPFEPFAPVTIRSVRTGFAPSTDHHGTVDTWYEHVVGHVVIYNGREQYTVGLWRCESK